MGAPPQSFNPTESVRPQAQANKKTREVKGELVHLTKVKGTVRVRRAGSFAWETVGEGGATVNASDEISVGKGGSVVRTSQTGGTSTISGATGQRLAQAGRTKQQIESDRAAASRSSRKLRINTLPTGALVTRR